MKINIETQHLLIRLLLPEDAQEYYDAEMASIKEMKPYWSWVNQNKTLEHIKAFLADASQIHQKNKPSELYFAIRDKQSNRFLGCVWFFIQWTVPRLEIAYWLDSRQTGKGYMTEAVRALAQSAFQDLKMRRIEIKHFMSNKKSQALSERVGFTCEGILKNYFIDFTTQEIIDGYVYACTEISALL